ncbi:hypothetical protein HDV00_001353 [Rhizophlyctis rosea]|nr:hypothetical protein HDV00_001353 [Rhizophlyctis rosea]
MDTQDTITQGEPMDTEPTTINVPATKPTKLEDILNEVPGIEIEDTYTYKFEIESWSQLRNHDKFHGPTFEAVGSTWRLLLFPNGNRQTERMSIFLESVEAPEHQKDKDSKWHICLQFAIAIANPEDETSYWNMQAQHRFNPSETDWGFNHFIQFNQLSIPLPDNQRPLVENDKTVIVIYMKRMKDATGVLWHNFADYDSKKETGFVGLKNQGATCYMNSLLQSLYFTSYFRKATYQIPTDTDEPQKSVPLALQRVFYNLQFSDNPVDTRELTKSFGWDTLDSFMQHDVQEFNRVLQDNLESKMKGTKAEGAITRLFVGKMKSYIKCINVDYESSRVEDYYDIQLNVKGMKNLTDSFNDYVKVETLDGENKYRAEDHGLQDAKKGVIFEAFPSVLHLQLKRFEYDIERDALVKINDRHEFSPVLELDDYLSEDAKSKITVPQRYHLHGVLVHSGDLSGGHYFALIRPQKNGKWYKFDDDRVVPVLDREVFEDNFGGEFHKTGQPNFKTFKRFTNAYMLVYVRESDLDDMLSPVEGSDIPEHLRKRLEDEKIALEKRRKEKEEAHLYMQVKVLTNKEIVDHEGFDLCNYEDKQTPVTPMRNLKTKKDMTFAQFKDMVGQEVGIPPARFRLWTMVGRQNKTIRPDTPISDAALDTPMHVLAQKHTKVGVEGLRLYLEEAETDQPIATNPATGEPIWFLPVNEQGTSQQFILFLKHYDPLEQKMRYAGKITMKSRSSRIGDLPALICARMQWPPNTEIRMYEEVKPTMIDKLDKLGITFQQAELGDGDIICFQKVHDPSTLPDPNMADVTQYFDSIVNRVTVIFRPRNKESVKENEGGDVEMVLSKKMIYDQAVKKLAEKIGADPEKVRLTPFTGQAGKSKDFKKSPTVTVNEMLGMSSTYSPTPNNIILYEVLDINVSELETKRYLKITYLEGKTLKEHGPYDILLPKTARAPEIMDAVLERVRSEQANAKPEAKTENGVNGTPATPLLLDPAKLRLFEVKDNKFHRYLDENWVQGILEGTTLYVEDKPPEEEEVVGQGDRMVRVFHYQRDPTKTHGIPFQFVAREGEMFSETKKRLFPRMGLNEKDFAKVKWTVVPQATHLINRVSATLEDGDILADKLNGQTQDQLGADHVDKSGKSSGFRPFEKAIKIFVSVFLVLAG